MESLQPQYQPQESDNTEEIRQVTIIFGSPFYKDKLNQPFSLKVVPKFIENVSLFRKESIQSCKNEQMNTDLIDKKISEIIKNEYCEYFKYFEEISELSAKQISDTLNEKLMKITEAYKKHQNRDQTTKELKQLESQPLFEDSAINQISNKFTSFLSKKKPDVQTPTIEQKNLRQSCEERFVQRFQKQLNVKCELHKCFYWYHLQMLLVNIDTSMKQAYSTMVSSEDLTTLPTSNPIVVQEYNAQSDFEEPIIKQTIRYVMSGNYSQLLTLLGTHAERDIFMKYLIFGLFPIKEAKLMIFINDIERFIGLYFYDLDDTQKLESIQIYSSLIRSLMLSTFQDLYKMKSAISPLTIDKKVVQNLIVIYMIIMRVIHRGENGNVELQRNFNEPQHRELVYSYFRSMFNGDKRRTIIFLSILEQEIAFTQTTVKGFQALDPMQLNLTKIISINESLKEACNDPNSILHQKTLEFLGQEGLSQARLELIAKPKYLVHKHIIIAISGFLSENADQAEDWVHLKKYCEDYGFPLLCVKWEAQSALQFTDIAKKGISNLNIDFSGYKKSGLKGLINMNNIKQITQLTKSTVEDGVSLFKKARNNAKLTGKLLGHFLALGHQFDSYSFSLIGFSLGSQVIKSTLNAIHKLGGKSPIHNVYFLGGATFIRQEKLLLQKQIYASVVSGKIKNVFTERDNILISFQQIFNQISIGRSLQYQQDPHNMAYSKIQELIALEMAFTLLNYDISSFCSGHLNYRKCLNQILEFIDFEF